MTTALAPIEFDAPLVNPAPNSLYAATTWPADPVLAPRWLPSGVHFRKWNYDGSIGVWTPSWDAAEADLTEDDVKTGERPEDLDPFVALTLYAHEEGDMTSWSRTRVDTHVAQNLRLNESIAVEKALAARMISDSPGSTPASDIVEAVSTLEALLGETGTLGMLHASPRLAARAAQALLIRYNGAALTTPLGHRWVFGGGYDDGLALKIAATSPTFGWRTEVAVRASVTSDHRSYGAVAERSVVVGYEAMLGYADLA